MLRILCFGNTNFREDSLAIRVGERLRGRISGVEFVPCGIDDSLLDECERGGSFAVLDVVDGIEGVRLVPPEEIKLKRTVTAHDIDIGFYLKLLSKSGKRVTVVGIPKGERVEKAADDVEGIIRGRLLQTVRK